MGPLAASDQSPPNVSVAVFFAVESESTEPASTLQPETRNDDARKSENVRMGAAVRSGPDEVNHARRDATIADTSDRSVMDAEAFPSIVRRLTRTIQSRFTT